MGHANIKSTVIYTHLTAHTRTQVKEILNELMRATPMIEVADIFRQHAGDYIHQFGQSMLPSHLRALQDIMACRTETLGGHVYCCDHCGEYTYAFHSNALGSAV